MSDGRTATGGRRSVRTALACVPVLALLVAAALAGRTLAGDPRPPVVLPAPDCPGVLGDALPGVGPSSVYLVPWGPVSGRVCVYPVDGRATPRTAPVGPTGTLDATRVAEAAGLLEDLPAAPAQCLQAPVGAGPQDDVAVLVLAYRPGATPTVGERLRVVVRRQGPCVVATNGVATVRLDDATTARLVGLAPVLRSVLAAR